MAEPPLTEPIAAPEIFFEGVETADVQNGVVKLVCFSVINTKKGVMERRVVARLTVPINTMLGLHSVTYGFVQMLKQQEEAERAAANLPPADEQAAA